MYLDIHLAHRYIYIYTSCMHIATEGERSSYSPNNTTRGRQSLQRLAQKRKY